MNYLIVDTSYYNFYRFYATKQWYVRAYPDDKFEDDYNWSINEVFWNKFKKMFLTNLDKMTKKFKIDKVIFARDCPRNNIWRMPFYSNYKGDRDKNYKKNNFQGGAVFKKCYSEIINTLVDNKQFYQIKIDKLEADDIIALSCSEILKKSLNSTIYVVSSDHDLLQIITPQINLIDAKMKSYNDKSYGSKKKNIFMKCVIGDVSDSIPKVFNKTGPKTALKLYDNPCDLLEKFLKNPGSIDKFTLNYLLVSFDNIPTYLKDNFIKIYNDLNIN